MYKAALLFTLICSSISVGAQPFTVGTPLQLPTGVVPVDIAIADFDHDGRMDIAVTQSAVNSVAIYRQAITGYFTVPAATYTVGIGPSALVSLDLDYSGQADDLVVACGGDGTFYALSNNNSPNGSLTVGPVQYYYGADPSTHPRLAVGYIDRDTRPDLLFGLSTHQPSMISWNYQSANQWAFHGFARTFSPPSAVLLSDLDGDSFPDIAASVPAGNEVIVYRHDGGNGAFPYLTSFGSPVHVPTLGLQPVDVTNADINQDSRRDLITANAGDSTVSLLLGTGAARFGVATLVHQSSIPRKVLVTDMDGDRRPDLITINSNNTLNIYHNTGVNGPSRFSSAITLPTGLNPVAIQVADFNGDRLPDLAVACADDNTVRLYYNTSALATRTSLQEDVSVFPNPVSNILHVHYSVGFANALPINVVILDLTGMKLHEYILKEDNTVDVSNLRKGVYLMRISSSNSSLTKKIEVF